MGKGKGHIQYGVILGLMILLFSACQQQLPKADVQLDRLPQLFPDYVELTIPENIAPLNFQLQEDYDQFIACFFVEKELLFSVHSNSGKIELGMKQWKQLTAKSKGREYAVEILAQKDGPWVRFQRFENRVVADRIDSYLVYRLIEPGFETWKSMGIYQRCLEDFEESHIITNEVNHGGCVNCHSFRMNDPDKLLFHMRGPGGGTVFWQGQQLSKVETKTAETLSSAVYPTWHPSGDFVAFSVNKIVQSFHALPDKQVEVLDTLSDLVLYDTRNQAISQPAQLATAGLLETFPTWAPDGKTLFYCAAKALPPDQYDEIRYDLYQVAFDLESRQFGQPELVVNASDSGKSISFPRVSPDGRYLGYCQSDYGNFSIWHRESDLMLLDLVTHEISCPELNSSQAESYHSWSSTGRWMVFSSRRQDGLYTRSYIAYFDAAGKFHKPFLLPFKDPLFSQKFTKAFNVPELVKSKVQLDPRSFERIRNQTAVPASFFQAHTFTTNP
ncbi:TolB family protein [Sunxiuqinia elliptica]